MEKIESYLNPKRMAILEEESVDVFHGMTRKEIDCKIIFINAALISSKENTEKLTLKQKDLASFLNIAEERISKYLSRHETRYNESEDYRSLSDKWIEKFCSFDSTDHKEHFKNKLKQIAETNSERSCKKMINILQELGFYQAPQIISEEELKLVEND